MSRRFPMQGRRPYPSEQGVIGYFDVASQCTDVTLTRVRREGHELFKKLCISTHESAPFALSPER